MPTNLQIANFSEDKRSEAVTALQSVADKYGLSYTLEYLTMTINLPQFDDTPLPVVGTVAVPEEETTDEA